jgi:FKBP-type peptidyl-prolyl cis-trans isomerase FkpA
MKNLSAIAALVFTLALTSCSAKTAKEVAPVTDEQKTAYAIGQLMSQQLATFDLKPEELALVQKGLSDGVNGVKTDINAEDYIPKVQALQQTRYVAFTEKNAKAGADYLTKAATEAGVTKTASGVVIKHTKEGTGPSPSATDNVKVHYEGRLIDGKVFDSSIARGEPAEFPLNRVIACWTEGVQTMKVGGKAQLTCPSETAYGERGSPPKIMPKSTLVFDVELLEILKEPAANP